MKEEDHIYLQPSGPGAYRKEIYRCIDCGIYTTKPEVIEKHMQAGHRVVRHHKHTKGLSEKDFALQCMKECIQDTTWKKDVIESFELDEILDRCQKRCGKKVEEVVS